MRKLYSAIALFLSIALNAQELKTSITWDNICAHGSGLPVIGELQAIRSDINNDSYWSVGCETLDRSYSDFDAYKQFLPETGVGYGRLQSGWARTEKVKGKYDFSWLDSQVNGMIEQGLKPWICLCYGNPTYSDDGYDLNARLFGEGKVMQAWEKYVAEVVKRYKGKVRMYEVWNEPDGGKGIDSYDTYAVLFDHTSKIIRNNDKNVKIASFGICTPDREYIRLSLKKMKELGCLDRMDYLTYHAYWPYPELIIPAVKKLQEDLKSLAPHVQLLQGETGCPGRLEHGHAMHTIEWDEYSQAKWDLRQMLTHFGLGIPYSIFTMVDLNYGWMQQSFGLVRMQLDHKPVYKRPKFYAVQHITSLFTTELKADNSVSVSTNTNHKVSCVGISKNGKKIGCALWLSDARPTSSLTRENLSISISGIEYKDPVYVDMLDGKIYSLPCLRAHYSKGFITENQLILDSVPLWDSPVVIIERGAIPHMFE